MRIIILFILFYPFSSFSQQISDEKAKEFIDCLINRNQDISDYVDSDEIKMSERLDIQYEDVSEKYLISYDIDSEIRAKIIQQKLAYYVKVQSLKRNYSKVVFRVPNLNYQTEYYFKRGKQISPISYHTKDWKRIETPHYVFIISDSTLFNQYSIDKLENYYSQMSDLLNYDSREKNRIESEKIYYYLCKDSEEIKKLTSFNTRGLYILAFDNIVTTFNAHYHELAHLLINYKLKKLPLFTQPFLQEGFAVAFGGRGGKEPNIILNLGAFIVKSKFLDYQTLLTRKEFYEINASISYPVSGLYNKFYINEYGIEKYLKLYLKYSGPVEKVEKQKILENELGDLKSWNDYLSESKLSSIKFERSNNESKLILSEEFVKIYEDNEKYYFELKDTLLIQDSDIQVKYKSTKFEEVFPHRKYSNEKYAIVVNESELSIYNLFTNNLVESYAASFSIPYSKIPSDGEKFYFSISKNIFDESLNSGCSYYN